MNSSACKAACSSIKKLSAPTSLVVGLGRIPFEELLAQTPLVRSARAKQIVQIQEAQDRLPAGPVIRLRRSSACRASATKHFLRDVVHAEIRRCSSFYHARTMGEWGVGTDAVSALDCWGFGLPGFQGMNLAKGSIRRMGFTPAGYDDTGGSLRLHFPDGNATHRASCW